jgi:hypothetical protein
MCDVNEKKVSGGVDIIVVRGENGEAKKVKHFYGYDTSHGIVQLDALRILNKYPIPDGYRIIKPWEVIPEEYMCVGPYGWKDMCPYPARGSTIQDPVLVRIGKIECLN